MATRKKNDQYDSILNKLGFDGNDLIVDQNNQYNKILSEDFTLGFRPYDRYLKVAGGGGGLTK